jgi:tryptophanyl-tRNA synthetase
MRAHAYKDAEAKNMEINVGVFDYPVLMAADILIQDADFVPVGKDQKQHIEYARDIAEKFNRIYTGGNEFFKLPKEIILQTAETIPGIDGQKMSKSYNNTIPLFADDETIEKQVMGIVTDSNSDTPENVFNIHKLFVEESALNNIYSENKGQYKILKEKLIEDIKNYIKPFRDKRKDFENKTDYIKKLLKKNGEQVNKKVSKKIEEVRKLVGYKIY